MIEDKGARPKVELKQPNTCGYVLICAQTDPVSVCHRLADASMVSIEPGFHSASVGRETVHGHVESVLTRLRALPGVLTANLFEAIYFDHGTLDKHPLHGRPGVHVARYDDILIVKTESVADAGKLLREDTLQTLVTSLRSESRIVDVLVAWNIKRADDVDRTRKGVFLINFFFSDALDPLLDMWDSTAGWWAVEGKMANSELLRPTEDSASDYAIINTARWDDLAPAVAAFGKESYGGFVLAKIDESRSTTMPSLYRLVA